MPCTALPCLLSRCLPAVQRHSDELPEGLAKMCILVQQPAADFAVRRRRVAGGCREQFGAKCALHASLCVQRHVACGPLTCLLPAAVMQEARGKLKELYGQVRALDLENGGGLTGELLAGEGHELSLGSMPACQVHSSRRRCNRIAHYPQSCTSAWLDASSPACLPAWLPGAAVADILLLYASTLHWFTCGECPPLAAVASSACWGRCP